MLDSVLSHFDRWLMLGLFACLAALAVERVGRHADASS